MKRRILITLLLIVLVPVGLFTVAFAYAQTTIAKDQISGLVENNLSGPGQQAELSGLAGVLPFDVKIGRFRLSDDEGTWLEVDDVRVQTSPRALLSGQIVVNDLGIARVAVNRPPLPGPERPEEEPEPAAEGGFTLPKLPLLPESIPVFRAERLHVDRIELGEPVIGEAAVFNLEGRAASNDEGTAVDANLDLRRIDEETASLTLDAGADFSAQTVRIDIQGSETGGLTALLSGQENAGDLALSITGAGPLDDFNGRIALNSANLADLGLDLAFGLGEIPKLVITGGVQTADGVLPPELTRLIGQDITIDIDAQETSPGLFAVRNVGLSAGEIVMTGGGEADINANTIDIGIELTLADLARAADLAGVPLGGSTRLAATIEGELDQPTVALDLVANRILADRFGVEDVGLSFRVTPLGSLNDGYPGVVALGSGRIEGLTQDGAAILAGQPVLLDIDARAPSEGNIELGTFRLTAGELVASANALLDAQTLQGDADASIRVADLAALLASLGPLAPPDLAIAGAVDLTLDAAIGEQAKTVQADLNLRTEGLSGLPSGADDITGPSPRLVARLDYQADGPVRVEGLNLTAAALGLTGDVTLDQASQELSGAINLSVPTLAALNNVAQQELEGSITADVGLGGTVSEPAVDLSVLIAELSAAGQAFERITLDANAGGAPDNLRGDARLVAVKDTEEVDISTGFGLEGPVVTISDLRINGPATDIGGNVTFNTETQLATGALSGGIEDIAALEKWTGQAIAGAVTLDTAFEGGGAGQDVRANIDASGIRGPFGTLESASLQADVKDVLGALQIDADAAIKGFAQEGMRIDDALVNIEGSLADLRLKAEATGEQNGPLTAVLEARASIDGTVQTIGPDSLRSLFLDKLEAEMQGQTFELQSPSAVTLEDGVLNLDQLDLKIGTGSIRGKASLGDDRVFAAFELDAFQLDTIHALGGPEMSGDVGGTIDIDGSPAAPVIVAALAIDRFALAHREFAEGFADIDADVRLGDSNAEAAVTLAGLGSRPTVINASLPMEFSFEPFIAEPGLDGLDAHIEGEIALAEVARFAAIENQILDGALVLDLTATGSVMEPDLGGDIKVVDGFVEDGLSGAVLQDIQVAITASGKTITIEQFKGRDDLQGSMSAGGKFSISADQAYPFNISLDASDMHLLNSDLGDAWIKMGIVAEGDMRRAAVKGVIESNDIDLRIPDTFAASVPTIDVREVNRPGVEPEDDKARQPPMAIDLDIAIVIPGKMFIRGRGLDSEWKGNLKIAGSATDPRMTGEIGHVRGHMDLLGKRFVIQQSVIDFTGAVPPDPDITFQANAETEEITAVLLVTGPASMPELTLTSEPERPQDEVLSYLLFGRDASEITPGQGLRLAAAANRLRGGPSVFDGLDSLRTGLGLDTLDLQSSDEGFDQSTARAGKYLTEDVYVEVERGAAANSGSARVRIDLTNTLAAESEVTENNETGVGLLWKYDY